MAWSLVNVTSAGSASGGAVSINKPTGAVDGNLAVIVAYLEPDTNTWASGPTGFTSAFTGANTGAFGIQIWYRQLSGDGASWTLTPTSSNFRQVVCAAYSGGVGTGDFLDVVGTIGQGDTVVITSQTAPAVTTTGTDDLLIMAYANFAGIDATSVTGAVSNLRVTLGGLSISDGLVATPTTTTTSRPSGGPGSESYAAVHIAFLSTLGGGGGGYTPRLSLMGVG